MGSIFLMGEKLEKMQESATKIIRRLKKILYMKPLKEFTVSLHQKRKTRGDGGDGGQDTSVPSPTGPQLQAGTASPGLTAAPLPAGEHDPRPLHSNSVQSL